MSAAQCRMFCSGVDVLYWNVNAFYRKTNHQGRQYCLTAKRKFKCFSFGTEVQYFEWGVQFKLVCFWREGKNIAYRAVRHLFCKMSHPGLYIILRYHSKNWRSSNRIAAYHGSWKAASCATFGQIGRECWIIRSLRFPESVELHDRSHADYMKTINIWKVWNMYCVCSCL